MPVRLPRYLREAEDVAVLLDQRAQPCHAVVGEILARHVELSDCVVRDDIVVLNFKQHGEPVSGINRQLSAALCSLPLQKAASGLQRDRARFHAAARGNEGRQSEGRKSLQ